MPLQMKVLLAVGAVLMFSYATSFGEVKDDFSSFVGFTSFGKFKKSKNESGETVLLSPEMKSPIAWDELVASWNADAPSGTFLQVEARALLPDHATRFYSLGNWSKDNAKVPRGSVRGQRDADGKVSTDTLILTKAAQGVQVRITLGGDSGKKPTLKFLGLSFCNTKAALTSLAPNKNAWGKIIPTPERSQHAYPQEQGWCSPTSLSMVLTRWSQELHRPEMSLDVPEVAASVYDHVWDGTGNWPFNTAFAGSFKGMRGYITRFRDLSEVEEWIAAGVPVIMSTPWHLLKPGRKDSGNGHIVTCIGFTENGDVVINDPATNLQKESVRHIYKREDVIKAWETSHNTVYLVYPESAKVPKDRFGHWAR